MKQIKQNENSEIDVLLRKVGRTGTLRSTNPGNAPALSGESHLDADSANAYAEGALPPATRARYAGHLADCGSCRRVVTELTLTSGLRAEGRRDAGGVEGALRYLRSVVTAVFAPAALLYALPALVVIAFITSVLVFTRNRNEAPLVARNEPSSVISSATSEGNLSSNADKTAGLGSATLDANRSDALKNGNSANDLKLNARERSGSNSNMNSDALKKEKAASESSSAGAPGAGRVDAPKRAPAESPEAYKATDSRDQLASASEQSVQEKASASTASVTKDQETPATVQKEQPSYSSRAATRRMERASAQKSISESKAAAPPPPRQTEDEAVTGGSKASREGGSETNGPAGRLGQSASGRAVQQRRANGHTFRREGKVWIDTAYSSSYSVLNISRRSEQYRALVADEPGIRDISQALSGEVILVWKGKAYHIR